MLLKSARRSRDRRDPFSLLFIVTVTLLKPTHVFASVRRQPAFKSALRQINDIYSAGGSWWFICDFTQNSDLYAPNYLYRSETGQKCTWHCKERIFYQQWVLSILHFHSAGISAIATGGGHTCVLGSTGDLWCWGYNYCGQLGIGSTDQQNSPVSVSRSTGRFCTLPWYASAKYHTIGI